VVTAQPDNGEAQYYLGDVVRQKGDLEGAVRAFETALKLRPNLQEAYYSLALTLKADGGRSTAFAILFVTSYRIQAEEFYKQGLAALGGGRRIRREGETRGGGAV